MKLSPLGLLLLVLTAGCGGNHYDLLLSNGSAITSVGKPVLSPDGYYSFKDINGQDMRVPRGRVRTIQSSSFSSRPDSDSSGVSQSGPSGGNSSSGKGFFLPR
ncbi:hypothetical protein LBMAG56_20990 [Verrucomicrobiota bacterium]|nr:hypothetical protein LBMAG56_20990 [Verrucomicrobiota bacterium]